MPAWIWVCICLMYGCVMFVLGAWWRENFADETLPYEPYIPADDYCRTARHLMEGK